MLEEILNLFQDICKPFKNKEGGEKLEIMSNWLTTRNIRNEYISGIGLIANKQDNPRVTLISHMDLIPKFQKGFSQKTTFIVKNINDIGDMVQGALDNTITNACAMLALSELLEKEISDVEVLFSEGEEVGYIGMKGYLNAYPDKSSKTFFINLDVTNDGWGTDMSIEYDRPNFKTVKKVQNLLSNLKTNIQGERFCDDMDAINAVGYAGFSFCLPTKGTIHSYKNKAKLESLSGYYEGLVILLSELNKIEKYEKFSGYNMNVALKSKNPKEFTKKLKKQAEKFAKKLEKQAEKRKLILGKNDFVYLDNRPNLSYQGSLFNYDNNGEGFIYYEDDYEPINIPRAGNPFLGGSTFNRTEKINYQEKYSLTEFQVNERLGFVETFMDFINVDKGIRTDQTFREFIITSLMEDRSFTVSEFAENLKEDIEPTLKLIQECYSNGALLIIEYNGILPEEVKFPCPDFLKF